MANTMAIVQVWLALSLAIMLPRALAIDGVFARNGNGDPVSWWVVFKLPMLARSDASSDRVQPTPCDCPPPNCSQLPSESIKVEARATGLCYLYADANNSTLRYFRELGYDCLGQGGNDPVSQTLRHIQPKTRNGSDLAIPEAKYWALFNDQFNGIAADSEKPLATQSKRLCSGGDAFSAHAKGAIAFDGEAGGFYLQTSTPNFPDPSPVVNRSTRGDAFIPLGCQKDNNVHFAQHMVGISLRMTEMNALGKQLQAARLCSGNFYQDLRGKLASAQLLEDGAKPTSNVNISQLYRAFLDPNVDAVDTSPLFQLTLREIPAQVSTPSLQSFVATSSVYSPLQDGQPLLALADDPRRTETESVTVIVKTPRATVPPWALVAEALQSDMSVASWWDGGFGIPNICAGDVYTNATYQFCLNDTSHGVTLHANGTAPYNVENLVEAAWLLPNTTTNVRWHLVGGTRPDGNHAKWGISTPRYKNTSATSAKVTFADLNMEGFPCSTACNGSQAGRGGSFFTFNAPLLHASLTGSLIKKACPCVSPDTLVQSDDPFETVRMCRMGCWHKIQSHFQQAELPVMSPDSASFWTG